MCIYCLVSSVFYIYMCLVYAIILLSLYSILENGNHVGRIHVGRFALAGCTGMLVHAHVLHVHVLHVSGCVFNLCVKSRVAVKTCTCKGCTRVKERQGACKMIADVMFVAYFVSLLCEIRQL